MTDINVGAITELMTEKVDLDVANPDSTGKSNIAKLSMPSNSYIDLTLGTTGSTYTATANGYLVLEKQTSSNGDKIVWLKNTSNGYSQTTHTAGTGNTLAVAIPMLKGQTAVYHYTADGVTVTFRFIYAQGEI